MFCAEVSLVEALRTARSLRGDLPLFPRSRVWIAPPIVLNKKPIEGKGSLV